MLKVLTGSLNAPLLTLSHHLDASPIRLVSDELIKPDTYGVYELDGTMTIRDLNRAMDWNLPDEHANTLAGLVLHEAQMIPAVGQVFRFHGFKFEVAGRDANRITLVRVRPLRQEPLNNSSTS